MKMVLDLATIPSIDWNTVQVVVTFGIGWLAKHFHSKYVTAKTVSHNFRVFFDALDNAIYNDKVDQQGLQTIYETGKTLVSSVVSVTPKPRI